MTTNPHVWLITVPITMLRIHLKSTVFVDYVQSLWEKNQFTDNLASIKGAPGTCLTRISHFYLVCLLAL